MRFSRFFLLPAVVFGAAMASPAMAQFVTPVSYTATPGQGQAQGGSFNYFDDTGTQLTDSVLGANNFAANLGNGPAFEWVGWISAEPTFTFTFAQPVTLSQVQIGLNRDTGAGINLPTGVNIGGTLFGINQTDLANNSRGFLSFATNFTGTSLTISLTDNNTGSWIFVDEVRFVSAVAAPEPGTLGLLLLGMASGVAYSRAHSKP